MSPQSFVMQYEKSTKGTHVYTNTSATAPIPTVYIKRDSLPKDPPKQIALTIEWIE